MHFESKCIINRLISLNYEGVVTREMLYMQHGLYTPILLALKNMRPTAGDSYICTGTGYMRLFFFFLIN